MSLSPVANRSFLHGDQKSSSTSNKIMYATLDSLALKRARLPLQLLPVDDNLENTETMTNMKKQSNAYNDNAAKRSNVEVDLTRYPARCVLATQSEVWERKRAITVKGKSDMNEQNFEKDLPSFELTGTDSSAHNNSIKYDEKRFFHLENNYNSSENLQESNSNYINSFNAENATCLKSKCAAEMYFDDKIEKKSLSDDYERIELSRSFTDISIMHEKTKKANEDFDKEPSYSSGISYNSNSTNDLSENYSDLRKSGGSYSAETLIGEKLISMSIITSGEHNFSKKKKKKKKKQHFAKNVLHFVPEYLARGPKRRKKRKNNSSSSLSSLKPLPIDTEIATNPYRSKSLSKEELKYVKISSPTNFVHVASATSPNLVLDEHFNKLSFEQVVITHDPKCATLPLLVARNGNFTIEDQSDTAFFVGGTGPEKAKEDSFRKDNAFGGSNLKLEFLSELQARSAKMLEQSQQVKISENQVDVHEEKLCEPLCELILSLPRANSSFLWNNQAKNLLENSHQSVSRPNPNENIENDDESRYDDVGPVNLTCQEDDYDDVGSPVVFVDERCATEPAIKDSDSIYDDVMTLRNLDSYQSCNLEENGRLISVNGSFVHLRNAAVVNSPETKDKDQVEQEDDHYLLISNEYSSVDEEESNETQDNEQGVYDDVGLPSEDRVNSLYAGSTSGSILGLTSTNGKESEWEDLDETTSPSPTKKHNLSTETQIVLPSKKKLGQKWSTKVRRQRSKISRKSIKLSGKPMPCNATNYVTVSLGSGSVLLVGYTEKTEEWRKTKSSDRAAEENLQRTQGLVQMRVIDLDEDMDTQETSCYVDEDNTSEDSTYESLHSFQPDDFSTDTDIETEASDATTPRISCIEKRKVNRTENAYVEAPTKPNPAPPREGSLTQTLGRRIKMLRRTWSFTKGSLGRIRRRTSVDDDRSSEENKDSSNDNQNYDSGRYFNFARHLKKGVTGLSTFYLNGNATSNDSNDSTTTGSTNFSKGTVYSNINKKESDQYSVLADQEPLYQFYAAAAARVTFDFGTDSYEQVQDVIPPQSTIDLVKPGRRTLWCQTPQVVHSGILQRLNMEARKIQEAKFEILTSEASYLNSLRVLENEFLNDSLVNGILTSNEKDKLFSGIPSVLHASEQFLTELETIWRHDPMLCGLPDVLVKYAEKCLDIYVAYCSHQVSIDATLKDLKARKGLKFLETVSQIETRSACQSLSLHSFLMLPMQRITRLPLLADAVLSKLSVEHTDRSDWEKVLSSLSYVAAECNEGARAATKEAEIEALARKLEFSTKIKPIPLKGRYLVKSGPVTQLLTKADAEYKLTFGKKFNKTPLYLLLLTDYLLVTKYKSNTNDETYTVIDTCKRNLIALESVPEDSPFAGRNAMLLTFLENYSGHQVEYILTCESNTERQRWLEAVSPSHRGLVEETLYESWDCPQVVALYCYIPNQPDELSLHPGNVINVLRKMSDGWFHGEKLLDGEQGWFPGNYTKEVASEHVRAKNLKQRHRLLTLSSSILQRKTK